MRNNLQANSLNTTLFSSYILTKKFILKKKISKDIWIKLDSSSLKSFCIVDNKINAKSKLFFKDGYFFVNIKPISVKYVDYTLKESEASIKIDINSNLKNGTFALSKMPLSAILIYKKEYIVEIYYKDAFYIKVKDIL